MLETFVEDVFTDTRRARFWGLECGSRMTIVRLADGGLFVHSPVALDEATRSEVDALGQVRAIVAPSIFHHLHVPGWMAAYPSAHVSACPGLEWKRPDIAFSSVLGDTPHPIWAGDLEQIYFSARRENEVVFFLPRRRLMICADSLLNLSTHDLASTRFVARLMGNRAPGISYLEPLMVRDRRLARRQVDRILEWDFDKAIVAHGASLDRDARDLTRAAYAWL